MGGFFSCQTDKITSSATGRSLAIETCHLKSLFSKATKKEIGIKTKDETFAKLELLPQDFSVYFRLCSIMHQKESNFLVLQSGNRARVTASYLLPEGELSNPGLPTKVRR